MMIIWEATNGAYINWEYIGEELTCLEVTHDGNKAFVGSKNGVLRVYNVSNRSMPKLVKIEKYSEFAISVIRESPNWKFILIGAKGDKEFWIINS